MTIAWGHLGSLWERGSHANRLPTVTCFVRPQRYTKEFMDREPLFTLSHLPASMTRMVTMSATINGHGYELPVPTDGTRSLVRLPEMLYADEVMLSGYWQDASTFVVRFRWYETCFTKELAFRFVGNRCVVDERMVHGDDPDLATGLVAEAF